MADVRAKYATLGMEPVGNSPAEFAAVIKSDLAKWANVVKVASIKAD
jgi:tripartite-type tricarboxylate transporter receptor subunit TctC